MICRGRPVAFFSVRLSAVFSFFGEPQTRQKKTALRPWQDGTSRTYRYHLLPKQSTFEADLIFVRNKRISYSTKSIRTVTVWLIRRNNCRLSPHSLLRSGRSLVWLEDIYLHDPDCIKGSVVIVSTNNEKYTIHTRIAPWKSPSNTYPPISQFKISNKYSSNKSLSFR